MVFMFDIYLPPNYPEDRPEVLFVSPIPDHLHDKFCSDGTIFISSINKRNTESIDPPISIAEIILILKGKRYRVKETV